MSVTTPSQVHAASLDRRFNAAVVDRAVAWTLLAGAAAGAWQMFWSDGRVLPGVLLVVAAWLMIGLIFAVLLGLRGTSPGRAMFGLKVIDVETEKPIGVGRAILRTAITGVGTLPLFGLGLATLAWTAVEDRSGARRGWHDLSAGSIVVDTRPPAVIEEEEASGPAHLVNLTAMRLKPVRQAAAPEPVPAPERPAPERPQPVPLTPAPAPSTSWGPGTFSGAISGTSPGSGVMPTPDAGPDTSSRGGKRKARRGNADRTAQQAPPSGPHPAHQPPFQSGYQGGPPPGQFGPPQSGPPQSGPPQSGPQQSGPQQFGPGPVPPQWQPNPSPPQSGSQSGPPTGQPRAQWRVNFDSGSSFVVEGLGLVGRAPQGRPGEPVRHVVPLASDNMSVSKTHAQFHLGTDGALVVMDRGSTNGSILIRRGVTRELSAGRPATLLAGDVVRFGDREMRVERVD